MQRMKIALFDRINETHVCTALEDALRALGHDVVATGPVWHGHRFAREGNDIAGIDAALDVVLAEGCDALFNFRASALSPRQLQRLRAAGVATVVWLPDDPVLYGVTYRAVVDAYDHVLHCGPASVLRFYDQRGHATGVNFPFWVDPERWLAEWTLEDARGDLVFLGNLHGPAKKGRYDLLAAAAGRIAIYGKCGADPLDIHRGELHGVDAMRAVLPRHAAGLNIRQRFADYAGTEYDFDGLASLGGFDLPSRVIQYAAIGLPVISLGPDAASSHFPHALQADDIDGALSLVDCLRGSPAMAADVSARARADVVDHFSARARARFLVALLHGNVRPRELGLHGREFAYRSFIGDVC
jgi:hypothetical protein